MVKGNVISKPNRTVNLPVLACPPKVRKSRTSKWRAAALIVVHLLMIGHFIHWRVAGRTLSPVEPSEAMYTLNQGHLNAGFIFFAVALLATLIFGRFVCGWGCHFIAYQDLCAWLLKKIRVKPKPLRARILVLAPLALALYMFVWPTVYRWFVGHPAPEFTNHILKVDYWETFPGPLMAIVTVLVAGIAVVYFLGAKGFCTYACPYGGFFGLVERAAPGRILVTDDCEHCGHCTAVCTSNVKVHEEVALFGMVVDPGCMKCMDCVSVCPKDALYFGFKKPAIGAKPKSPRKATPYDFSLAEEWIMAVAGLAGVMIFRGLYDQIPLLLAMAMGGMFAYAAMKGVRIMRTPNVRWQNLQLKHGGRVTRAGTFFAAGMAVALPLTLHSATIQFSVWRGHYFFEQAQVGDDAWLPGTNWFKAAAESKQMSARNALEHLERADRWGFLPTYTALKDLVWLYLANDRADDAEKTVRRMISMHPQEPDAHRGLGGVLRRSGRIDESVAAYEQALKVDPAFEIARKELIGVLLSVERTREALAVFRAGLSSESASAHDAAEFADALLKGQRFDLAREALEGLLARWPNLARAHWLLGVTKFQLQDVAGGLVHFRKAVELEPSVSEYQYDLGQGLLQAQRIDEAIPFLKRAVDLKSDFALAHYNLGVALFMSGRPKEAIPHATEAARLEPDDPTAKAFLNMLQQGIDQAP